MQRHASYNIVLCRGRPWGTEDEAMAGAVLAASGAMGTPEAAGRAAGKVRA